MDLKELYAAILELQEQLAAQHHDAEIGCLDYKVVKALGATYELQDYLANLIAQGDHEPEGEAYGLLELIVQMPKIGKLTPQQERYIASWDKLEVSQSLFRAAYERTYMNTGELNWAYLNALLKHYRARGYINAEDVIAAEKIGHHTPGL